MGGRFSQVVLGAVFLGGVAVLCLNQMKPNPQLFSPQKLEVISASEYMVPVSAILPMGVAKVCVLGPYSSVEFHLATVDPKLSQQMDQTSVDEGSVRIATFDNQSKILSEYDLPRGRGQVRIALGGMDLAFCKSVETVMIKVVKQENFMTVQFAG